jgi:hypothetical protein
MTNALFSLNLGNLMADAGSNAFQKFTRKKKIYRYTVTGWWLARMVLNKYTLYPAITLLVLR